MNHTNSSTDHCLFPLPTAQLATTSNLAPLTPKMKIDSATTKTSTRATIKNVNNVNPPATISDVSKNTNATNRKSLVAIRKSNTELPQVVASSLIPLSTLSSSRSTPVQLKPSYPPDMPC